MAVSLSGAAEADHIIAVFRKFDVAGNGTVREEQLLAILQALDPDAFTKDEVSPLLDRISVRADGQVSYEEFLRFIWNSDKRVMPSPASEPDQADIPSHGVLVIGRRGSGKTSLVLSLLAQAAGAFPSRKDVEIHLKRTTMPETGQPYELPALQHGRCSSASGRRTVLIDTAPYGDGWRSERPLCERQAAGRQQSDLPRWILNAWSAGDFQSRAVIVVLDGTDMPLWEDSNQCGDLAKLIVVLQNKQIPVAIAVTKLSMQRETALHEVNCGKAHGGRVERDPRSNYETFVGRYVEKVATILKARLKFMADDAAESEQSSLLRTDKTIFDTPTWTNVEDFRSWQAKRGTMESPNFRYAETRLKRLLLAASTATDSHAVLDATPT